MSLVNSYMPTPITGGFEAPYVPVQTAELEREAAKELVNDASEPGAGLVVAGSSGKGYFGRLLTGSVSESLMHKLDRPLLIVPAPQE